MAYIAHTRETDPTSPYVAYRTAMYGYHPIEIINPRIAPAPLASQAFEHDHAVNKYLDFLWGLGLEAQIMEQEDHRLVVGLSDESMIIVKRNRGPVKLSEYRTVSLLGQLPMPGSVKRWKKLHPAQP